MKLVAALLGLLLAAPALAQTASVEKLYVIDCGHGMAPDQSRWSPGFNVGVALGVRDNCYLIKHAQGWLLWDTGVADRIAAMPDGQPSPAGLTHWRRAGTLAPSRTSVEVRVASTDRSCEPSAWLDSSRRKSKVEEAL